MAVGKNASLFCHATWRYQHTQSCGSQPPLDDPWHIGPDPHNYGPLPHLQLVCDQHPCSAAQHATNAALKQDRPHVCIHCTEGVIQQVHISTRIHCPCQRHAVLLQGVTTEGMMHNMWEFQCLPHARM
jgi:hypothetical protein